MDNEPDNRPDEERADIDYRPKWPQRPPASGQGGRAGLDPKGNPRPTPSQDSDITHWTAHPTSSDLSTEAARANDPKATRQLPVVDRSRFEIGRQAQQPVARVERTAPPPPPPPTPRPPSQGAKAQASNPQPPVAREELSRTQVRQPTSWEDYAPADEETLRYKPVQGPKSKVQGPKSRGQERQVRNLRVEGKPLETGAHSRYLGVDLGASKKRRGLWVLWVLAGVFAIALIGVIAFTLAWQGQYAGKIYAGVNVLGADLSGKTPDEARKILLGKVQEFVTQPMVLTWRNKEWRPNAEQLGLKVDVDSTVEEALKVGRTPDMFGSVGQQWAAAQGGYSVPLAVQMSEPTLQVYLTNTVAPEIDQELLEGDVRLDGTRVVALPGVEGRSLQVYQAIIAIRDSLIKLETGKVDLPVEVRQPAVSSEEVSYIEALLTLRVSAPITATAWPGKSFTLDREALIRFTTIERNPDPKAERQVQLGWKDKELEILSESWAKQAKRPAQNARFAWRGGQVSVLSESIDGFETDAATVAASIKEHAETSDVRTYDLPGKVITPTVSSNDLTSLGIKELIGKGTSTFAGSTRERITNIQVAANLLNGAVVPPGGTFSFLDTMGGIDEAHGFVQGYVIAAERTVLGVGGGVCQVSTTMFRAAFWSGVDITERNQHSYRVGWYEAGGEPVGFDAAVFDPGVDLRFKNNTPGYLLIEAVVGGDLFTVNIYGTKPPGEVKLEGPVKSKQVPPPPDVYQVDARLEPGTKKQVETARAGLDVVITRRIIVPGQPDKVEQYGSSYQAWPNWYIVASPSQIPGGSSQAKPTPVP